MLSHFSSIFNQICVTVTMYNFYKRKFCVMTKLMDFVAQDLYQNVLLERLFASWLLVISSNSRLFCILFTYWDLYELSITVITVVLLHFRRNACCYYYFIAHFWPWSEVSILSEKTDRLSTFNFAHFLLFLFWAYQRLLPWHFILLWMKPRRIK